MNWFLNDTFEKNLHNKDNRKYIAQYGQQRITCIIGTLYSSNKDILYSSISIGLDVFVLYSTSDNTLQLDNLGLLSNWMRLPLSSLTNRS